MKNIDKMSDRELRNEVRDLRDLRNRVDISAGLKCPNCDDTGGYPMQIGPDEVIEQQCEFCWTVPDSVFMRSNGDGQ